MRRWLVVLAIVTIVPGLAFGSAALGQAQSKTAVTGASARPTGASARPTGAFDKLSLGNQTVAASLYLAQNAGTSPTGSTIRPFTLDQIAAKRQAGQGWGQIFRDLKAQGLVQEKSLGQVVTKYGQFTGLEPRTTASLSGNGKSNALGAASNGSVDGGTHSHGGK